MSEKTSPSDGDAPEDEVEAISAAEGQAGDDAPKDPPENASAGEAGDEAPEDPPEDASSDDDVGVSEDGGDTSEDGDAPGGKRGGAGRPPGGEAAAGGGGAGKWVAIVLAVLILGGGGIILAMPSQEEVVQPIAFNHKIHIDGDIDCLQCHEGLIDRTASKLPTVETCTGCHDEAPPDDKPELQKLAGFAERGEELPWDPTLRLPDHVFFPHDRHVLVAELECTECHSDMPHRTSPPVHRRVIHMMDCISCHQDHPDSEAARRASVDCASCHR